MYHYCYYCYYYYYSIRGSDPDAALYWLGRMVYAGEVSSITYYYSNNIVYNIK